MTRRLTEKLERTARRAACAALREGHPRSVMFNKIIQAVMLAGEGKLTNRAMIFAMADGAIADAADGLCG